MPITSVTQDADTLSLTVDARFDAALRRLWDAYLDPRMLERFWGPPTYPAVFTRHDGCVGGRSEYTMTGPDGDVSRGYWEWVAVDELKSFEVRDGFANPDGTANTKMPTMRMIFAFEAIDSGSRVTTTTYFNSADELEQLLGMGMEEGMTAAMGQTYRYEWARVDGAQRFGFTGTLLESLPPHRDVTTEAMIDTAGPSTVNELTLTPVEAGTLLSILITYPDAEVRDANLATGMTDGMEASYARLESLIG